MTIGVMTHGSVLKSAIHPHQIAEFLNDEIVGALHPTIPITDWNLSQSYLYGDAMKGTDCKPIYGLLHNINNITVVLYALTKEGYYQLIRIFNGFPIEENCSDIACVSPEFLELSELSCIPLHIRTSNPIAPAGVLRASEAARLKVLLEKNKVEYGDIRALNEDITDWSCIEPIFDAVEVFELGESPKLPHFPSGGLSEEDLLRKLCFESLQNKNLENSTYRDRLNYELSVFEQSRFSGYFLIMWDICKFIQESGSTIGQGRGSASGCLASYLLGITKVDPLQYNLMFERFYSADRASLPDIDLDISPDFRPRVTEHLKDKYGNDKLAQLCTFSTLKGKSALKVILGQAGMSFREQNEVTDCLPEEAKIDPELKDQYDKFGTKSVVLYALQHSTKLDPWCKLTRKGEYRGKWANQFRLAVEIDRTNHAIGKHASAFVLADRPLPEKYPLIDDPAGGTDRVCGFEMMAAERAGLVKLDLLGVDVLSKYEYLRKTIADKSLHLVMEG